MRIACIYLPAFPLQVHVRKSPHLVGTHFAVTNGGEHPSVIACSKAAWAAGVRPGMSATQARASLPELEFIPGHAALYAEAARSLGEGLLSSSVTVDIGEADAPLDKNKAIYLLVPPKKRGTTFANELFAHLNRQGYRARVGIADDRYTAWVAALTCHQKDKSELFVREFAIVPAGASASFLTPRSLDLLPLSDDIRHMLHSLGIHTMGDFAALPPPSVGKRWNENGIDYQALACGEGSRLLHSFVPVEAIREEIDLDAEAHDVEPLFFSLRPLAERACDRLRGRGQALSKLQLSLKNGSQSFDIPVSPSRPTLSVNTLLDLLRAKLADISLPHPVASLSIEVLEEAEPEPEELDLFNRQDATLSADSVDIAIARLQSNLGQESLNTAEVINTHAPEAAFRLTPFIPPENRIKRARRARRRKKKKPASTTYLPLVMNGMVGALRLLDPPRPQSNSLRKIELDGISHKIVASKGPTRIDTSWWTDSPVDRDYYEVETADGGRYWVFKQRDSDSFFLHGIFD